MPVEKWSIYTPGETIHAPGKINKSIIRALHSIYDVPVSRFKTGPSNKIKYVLIMLGYELGYCGYANITKGKARSKMVRNINGYIKTHSDKLKLGNHRFHNTEWLFDIHWYRDKKNTHFTPTHLYMACESELQKRRNRKKGQRDYSGGLPYQAARYDFQKLLACNAQLRLMIFKVDKEIDLIDRKIGLAAYFKKAIHSYKDLPKDSKFLFACFIGNQLHYHHITK